MPHFGHAMRTFNASLGLVKSTIYYWEYFLNHYVGNATGYWHLGSEDEDDSDAVLLGDRRCIPLCINLSNLVNESLRSSCDDGDGLLVVHWCL